MRQQIGSTLSTLVVVFAATCALAVPTAYSAEPFGGLKGSWSGGGKVSFAGGQTERIKCSARYSGGGSKLSLTLRCASSSAQISLVGNLSASGNRVSGSWSESSYGISGSANGSVTGSSMRLRITGGASGSLNIATAGSRQTVALSSEGTLTGVNISLRRK